MKKIALRDLLLLIGISIIVACATYSLNLWLFSSNPRFSPASASFIEGLLFIIAGVLFLLGSGGISRTTQRAAVLAASAEAIFHKETIGPSEIFKKDAWKPKGFTRLGLILIMTGIILLAIYFISP